MSGSAAVSSGVGKDHGHGATLVRAVEEVDLEIGTGEAVAIVGPSGCGKSSLLYLLGGLERPTAGTIASPATTSTGCRRPSWPGFVGARSDSCFRPLSSSTS